MVVHAVAADVVVVACEDTAGMLAVAREQRAQQKRRKVVWVHVSVSGYEHESGSESENG